MKKFRTVSQYGEIEIEIQKSRFIGSAQRVDTEEEIVEFLQNIKKKFPQARHYCSAWVLGESGLQKRYDDDKEPQGTAGLPILSVLEGTGLTNTCVIVTRYFGGILLGTGGLARAYGRTAKLAVEAAKPVLEVPMNQLNLILSYADWGIIENRLLQNGIEILNTEYLQNVHADIVVEPEERVMWVEWITDATKGVAMPQDKGVVWRQKPIINRENINE